MSKAMNMLARAIKTGSPIPRLYGAGSCGGKRPRLCCPGMKRLYFYDSLAPELLWLGLRLVGGRDR